MFQKLKTTLNLIRNMGWRYANFRIRYELMRRTGMVKRKFPVAPENRHFISLQEWKELKVNFFFNDKSSVQVVKQPFNELKKWFDDYRDGKMIFFSSTVFDLGKDYDWVTNPDTGFVYDIKKHWTEIADYSKEAGDIKYVWEKSRFSFLYSIIRYDYHFDQDCSEMVFNEIMSWIDHNPVNCGPNYRCSQEISLRVLNWVFALYYYKNSSALTDEVFQKIIHHIYWQIKHIYGNINFSRIAVRNNHAITETMTLYLSGILFPFFPEAKKWKTDGKKWFEEEIGYQVYEDGTFLQFSMNYHRVVVQLLTWAIVLSEKNNESFEKSVYDRAKKSVEFLRTCMVDENGFLPNYGANDGALFFKLNEAAYRDYRPQLAALASALKMDLSFEKESEDINWYGLADRATITWEPALGIHAFDKGGYYLFREAETLTFIRCGNHKDRPSQADNLHLDVFYKGQNILLDGGSYKYNTDRETLQYFMGTASHNTVMLENFDQMKKGSRFIWYNWTQKQDVFCKETKESYHFKGSICAFSFISKKMIHDREVMKVRNQPKWIIKDIIHHKPTGFSMKQLWHLPLDHFMVNWKSTSEKNEEIVKQKKQGYFSGLYGKKEPCEMIVFETKEDKIITEFEIAVGTEGQTASSKPV